jgi:hypothetical protein
MVISIIVIGFLRAVYYIFIKLSDFVRRNRKIEVRK